jgi:hypothetical protein
VVITGVSGQDISRTPKVKATNKNKKRHNIAHALFIHNTINPISRLWKKKAFTQYGNCLTKWHPASGRLKTSNL